MISKALNATRVRPDLRVLGATGVSAPLFAAFLKIAFLGVWGGGWGVGEDNDVLVGRLF